MAEINIHFTPAYIRRIESVELQPVTQMSCWQLMQVLHEDGTRSRHLIGVAHGAGRVTSDITKLDVLNMRATTKSGRVYLIHGRSGLDGDAAFVWGFWKEANLVKKAKLVSNGLLKLHQMAIHSQDPSGAQK